MRNKLAKNSIAVGLVTLIVTAGLSFSAQADPGDVAQSEASAITATGITGIVDTGVCRAESTTGTPTAGTGTCDVGLTTQGVGVFGQNAFTGLDGMKGESTAIASVAPINIPALTTIDLSTVQGDLDAIDTATILDDILLGLDPITAAAFDLLLTPVLTQIQTAALAPILAQLQAAVPVSVQIGVVSSMCELTAGSAPVLDSEVAGIDILIELAPGNVITVPITLDVTTPNSALVGSVAPQQIIDGLLNGLESTLIGSLGGALAPLGTDLIDAVLQPLVDEILAQVGPALLDPLGVALTPILDGTVNKQETLPDGSVEVTAIELNVIGETATLDLARSQCGPNGLAVVADDAPADDIPADDAPADDIPADDLDNDVTDADAAADADSQADADVTTTLPATGSPNLLPFWMLGLGLLLFGATVLLNEKRRLQV